MIINTNSTVAFNPANSLSLPVGDNLDGDMIVIAYAIRNTGATITCTDFTHQSSATTTSWKCGFLTKVNSGSTTTGPVTVSSTASSYFGATAYVIRGQHATPVGANNSSTSAGTARLASSGLTTTADNSLVLHSFATDRSLFAFPEISGFSLLSNNFTDSGTIISGAEGAGATGAISTFYWDQSASTQCIDAVLEIKMASGNAAVKVVPGRTAIFYHGGYDPSTPTRSAPNSVTGLTAIKSISLSSTEPTYTNTAGTTGWIFQGIGFDTSTATTQWDGAWEAATLNLTGKILSFPWAISRANFTDGRVGSYGVICCLADSANNWVAFTLRDSADGWVANKSYTAFIKYGSTPVLESSQSLGGTEIDISDVVKIGFFWHRLSGGGAGSTLLYVGPTWYESAATVITGGVSAYPLNTELITNALGTNTYWPELFPRQGASQYLNKINLQIGDGTRLTNYKSTGQSFEFPTANGVDWTLADGDVGLTLKSSASDTFDLSSSIFSGGSMQGFTIDSGGSTSATYTLTGASFIGLNWACEIAKSYSGASFSDCNLVELGGGTISGVTVSTPSGTNAAVVNLNSATIDSSTLSVVRDGTDASYHLELGTSVTAITLTDVTWTGTPVTNKVHVLKTTGTVTINISGTTSLAAGDVTSAGATVSIVSDPVYQVVVVSGFTAGSRIQIYDTTNSVELFNGTASAGNTVVSGSTATWTDPSVAAGNRAIRVRVAYVSGATAKLWQQNTGLTCGTSSTTNSVTYPITQVADTTYDSNAVDGSGVTGITFTDAATDLVNINIAADTTPLKDIYAAFVYWLFTAAGIDDDVAYIDAPDPANYIMTSMKFRNTSTDPLKITGGYFYDSTGSVENCVDVAGSSGNIYPMPAHVVPYQTTGTYAITGDLQDALDAIAGVPADVIAVAVDGSTTLAESLRLANAVLGGKVSGAGSGTESFRDLADTKNRVVATVDSSGNRTALTRDLT